VSEWVGESELFVRLGKTVGLPASVSLRGSHGVRR